MGLQQAVVGAATPPFARHACSAARCRARLRALLYQAAVGWTPRKTRVQRCSLPWQDCVHCCIKLLWAGHLWTP